MFAEPAEIFCMFCDFSVSLKLFQIQCLYCSHDRCLAAGHLSRLSPIFLQYKQSCGEHSVHMAGHVPVVLLTRVEELELLNQRSYTFYILVDFAQFLRLPCKLLQSVLYYSKNMRELL